MILFYFFVWKCFSSCDDYNILVVCCLLAKQRKGKESMNKKEMLHGLDPKGENFVCLVCFIELQTLVVS